MGPILVNQNAANSQLPRLVRPPEQQRQPQEQEPVLQVLQQRGAAPRQFRRGAAKQLFPGIGRPHELAAANGARFIDEGADLLACGVRTEAG